MVVGVSEFCFFRHLGGCSGHVDRMHWIPKQRLRHRGLSAEEVWDRRIWDYGCRRHHHLFDNGFINLGREQLPAKVEDYAAEKGLGWSLDRDYGSRVAA